METTMEDKDVEGLGKGKEVHESRSNITQAYMYCIHVNKCNAKLEYRKDNLDTSLQFLYQWRMLSPDNTKCLAFIKNVENLKEMRKEAGTLFEANNLVEAKVIFVSLLTTVESGQFENKRIESKMHYNIALISYEQDNYTEAFLHATKAIKINPKYIQAYCLRGKCYAAQEMYAKAGEDYETIIKLDARGDHSRHEGWKKELGRLKNMEKKVENQNYYEILGVQEDVTEVEIRNAYKKRALTYHPDRHVNATEEVQKHHEKTFKNVGKAYEVLSDKVKRRRYDNGSYVNGQ